MNNQIVNVFLQLLTNGQNPNQVIQNAINQNPQIQILFNQMQQSGMSMKDFTLQYAKQNNINVEPIIGMLSQKGYKF